MPKGEAQRRTAQWRDLHDRARSRVLAAWWRRQYNRVRQRVRISTNRAANGYQATHRSRILTLDVNT